MRRVALALPLLALSGCATHHRTRIAAPEVMHGSCASGSQLCIEADQMPQDATHAMFGPLRSNYGSAAVRVCSKMANATTVPLALIESEIKETNGITVVPSLVALSVIAGAQAHTKTSMILSGTLTAAQIAAGATQLSGISSMAKSILTNTALGGGTLYGILRGATASASMLQFSSVTLPETLQFQPFGCASGIVLDYSQAGVPPAGSVSFGIMLPGVQ